MRHDVEPVSGSEAKLRASLSAALRAFVAQNRGVLSAAELAEAGMLQLVDAAWHMGGVTLPEPRSRSFIGAIVEAAFVVVRATDPAEMVSMCDHENNRIAGIVDPLAGPQEVHSDEGRLRQLAEQFLARRGAGLSIAAE